MNVASASSGEFTQLERAVLQATLRRQGPSGSEDTLSAARVMSRENTGAGFYTGFEIAGTSNDQLGWPWMIDGPLARVQVVSKEVLMGFILWGPERGGPQLEGFQYGNDVDLYEYDLFALQIISLEWARAS